ncbi:acyltransferase, partial [Campylobacter coli]|uniref:acyltransferase n=1 Tax=Campylobacter coli TaxID=195 RepID=UPI00092FB9FD
MKYIRDKNNNIIYYFYNESLKDIIVNFNTHKNNIIFIVGNINNIKVDFFGSNSVVFLGDNCSLFHIEIASESVCYIGDNTTSGGANLVAIENQNIIIGNDCLFSWEILLTTSNYHGIYDIHNKNRVSLGGGIYIGDHVWCGRRVSILKNSRIYSGSIIGFNSLLCSRKFFSNSIIAGNPAKKIKDNIFWIKDNIDTLSTKDISIYDYCFKDDYIFHENINDYIDFDFIDKAIHSFILPQDKLCFVYDVIYKNKNKNRFTNFGNMNKMTIERNYYFFDQIQMITYFAQKYGTAKTRIQNQLSYKLGQAMIVNSKSFLGYIR